MIQDVRGIVQEVAEVAEDGALDRQTNRKAKLEPGIDHQVAAAKGNRRSVEAGYRSDLVDVFLRNKRVLQPPAHRVEPSHEKQAVGIRAIRVRRRVARVEGWLALRDVR